jgi:hypothetical protein
VGFVSSHVISGRRAPISRDPLILAGVAEALDFRQVACNSTEPFAAPIWSMRASIWWSASTGPASGVIGIAGWPRRLGCCVLGAVGSCHQQRPGHPQRASRRRLRPGAPRAAATGPVSGGMARRRGRVPPCRGEWIRVLSVNGSSCRLCMSCMPGRMRRPHQYYEIATAQWVSQWPVEDLWAARLVSRSGRSG